MIRLTAAIASSSGPTLLRGALAGAAACGAWAAAEPLARRLAGTTFSDVRLLGAIATRGRRGWRPAGLALHLVNGAVFGAVFAGLGGRGWRAGVVAAELENALLWPGMLLVDRIHPDRRSGAWPPLFSDRRVLAQEVAMHALFGVVLGLLLEER
jgi:hypothetical protein